ncbi:MAG: tetratricopeptide repeat protein [Treponematales bacterium]
MRAFRPFRRAAAVVAVFAALLLAGERPAAQAGDTAFWYSRGLAAMESGDWAGAVESFLECLRLNPAHTEASGGMARAYYGLGEFDESLVWVRKARALARGDLALANLEASVQTALGFPGEAEKILNDIFAREPYNREALFTAAELDISRGRAGDAALRYREAVNRFPGDKRLTLSLALTLGSLGDWDKAKAAIDTALERHPGDAQVNYYAAYLYAQAGLLKEAAGFAGEALARKPGFLPALPLLAALRYRTGEYTEAAALADRLISLDRGQSGPWYLKGLCLARMGRVNDALAALTQAAGLDGEDEFVRASLEELLIAHTPLENPARQRWAETHFESARGYRAGNLIEQALFEYRRGLRLNPYAKDRREYAGLLRVQGYPAKYLEELRFLQDQGMSDKALDDAVESYNALLGGSLARRWGADPVAVSKPHWKLAVFSTASQSGFYHPDAGAAAAAYVKDILVHERGILPLDLELRQESFSAAFRQARQAGADYFLVVSVSENERDISLRGELFVARTGSRAAEFSTFRTGPGRLRYAARGVVEQAARALPFRGELIGRKQAQGLIDKGRADGVAKDAVYLLVRKRSARVKGEGVGVEYDDGDITGRLTVTEADEEVAAGALAREGFFDRVTVGDEVFLAPEEKAAGKDAGRPAARPAAQPPRADPELRALLRALRLGE